MMLGFMTVQNQVPQQRPSLLTHVRSEHKQESVLHPPAVSAQAFWTLLVNRRREPARYDVCNDSCARCALPTGAFDVRSTSFFSLRRSSYILATAEVDSALSLGNIWRRAGNPGCCFALEFQSRRGCKVFGHLLARTVRDEWTFHATVPVLVPDREGSASRTLIHPLDFVSARGAHLQHRAGR